MKSPFLLRKSEKPFHSWLPTGDCTRTMSVFELQTGVCAICPLQTYHWGVKSEGGWRWLAEVYWYVSKSRYPTVLWSKVWMFGMVSECHSFSVPVRERLFWLSSALKQCCERPPVHTLLPKHNYFCVCVVSEHGSKRERAILIMLPSVDG